MKLSVIIPVFNEELRLENSINEIINYCQEKFNNDYEILIIDDGSSDKTRKIAKKYNLILNKKRKNFGKGYSLKEGFKMAKGDLILFTDSDLSTPIKELDKFLKLIKKFDILIASRALEKSKIKSRKHKILFGRISNFFISLLVKNIKDTQCGFKLFEKDVGKELFEKSKIYGWGFDFEILYLAQKSNYKILEIPINWTENIQSKVKLKDYPKTFLDLIKIKYLEISGKYK